MESMDAERLPHLVGSWEGQQCKNGAIARAELVGNERQGPVRNDQGKI